jgi:hypothetical protein
MRHRRASRTAIAASCLLVATGALAQQTGGAPPAEPPIVVCKGQQYALCAAATCWVYNGVAYCTCEVLNGDSISLRLAVPGPAGERDVCELNRQGRTNGYMLSTFSVPAAGLKGGSAAVYTCPGTANAGNGVAAPVAYGQCDGGICFRSTSGHRFPGSATKLESDEIVCACPLSTASTPGAVNPLGYQLFGPYRPQAPAGQRCVDSGCALCSVPSPAANGSVIPVGAPSGVGKILAVRLSGPPAPELNECPCTCSAQADGTTACTVAGLVSVGSVAPIAPPELELPTARSAER